MVWCYTSLPCILVTSFRNFLELQCYTSFPCISVAPFRDFFLEMWCYISFLVFGCKPLFVNGCYTSLSLFWVHHFVILRILWC